MLFILAVDLFDLTMQSGIGINKLPILKKKKKNVRHRPGGNG